MELKEFATKYGNQATEELLDIALIKEFHYKNSDWRSFCIRHKIIKKTTKVIYVRQSYKSANGTTFHITLANGRGEWVLHLNFHMGHIREWQGEQ